MGQKTEKAKEKMICELEKLKKDLIGQVKEGLKEIESESDKKGPSSLIFAYEGIFAKTGHLTPIVSDWRLSTDKDNKEFWYITPYPGEKGESWDYDIVQSLNEGDIPEPTFQDNGFRSILTGETWEIDGSKLQEAMYSIRRRLIAVAYRDGNGKLVFRKPDKENQEFQRAEQLLIKKIFKSSDTAMGDITDQLRSEDITPTLKLCIFTIQQEWQNLFYKIRDHDEKKADTVKNVFLPGIYDSFRIKTWNPEQGYSEASSLTSNTDCFSFCAEPCAANIPEILEHAVGRSIQAYKELLSMLDIRDLSLSSTEVFCSNPEELCERTSKASLAVAFAEDLLSSSKKEGVSQINEGHLKESSPFWEFITEDYLVKIVGSTQKDILQYPDRDIRRKNLAESFTQIKKVLKDDGILAVRCEKSDDQIVEDVKEGLTMAGFEVRQDWEMENSGRQESSPGSFDLWIN